MLTARRTLFAGLTILAGIAAATPAAAESNMLFILDSSNSMWGQINQTSKIAMAKSVLANLLMDLPPDTKVGLMAYGHRAAGDCKDVELLSGIGASSTAGLLGKIKNLTPKGKTPIAESLSQSEAAFKGLLEENNNIVLISDGIETCEGDPCAVAASLIEKGLNVRVHVVGFDVDPAARAQLQCIADAGNGRYFDAQSAQELSSAVAEVKEVAAKAPEPAPKPEPEPEPEIYFEDNFDGDVVAEHWDVINPDTESYIVEDGSLLVVYQDESSIGAEALPNLFRLTTPVPKGDWRMTVRLQAEFQTMRETMYFGLYEDRANYMIETLYVNSWCCYARNLSISATKNAAGDKTDFAEALSPTINHGEGNFDPYRESFGKLGDGILLRLTKTGRQYVFAGRIEGQDQNGKPYPWVSLPKLTSLRQKGDLVFGFTQGAGGGRHVGSGGESIVNVDWVKIEVLK